ncbi:MAG: NUDIX domain-containing protein [Terricaulis sp.]
MTDWRIRFSPVLTPIFRVWWRMSRAMTLGVRVLVTDEAGRILLVRHTYSPGWHFPGGGVEHGENSADAAMRELMEEGGVETIGPLKLIGFYANHANFPNDHIALYHAETWRPCAPLDNGEIAERGFFAVSELPDGIRAGTRRRIAELFQGAPPSAEW